MTRTASHVFIYPLISGYFFYPHIHSTIHIQTLVENKYTFYMKFVTFSLLSLLFIVHQIKSKNQTI